MVALVVKKEGKGRLWLRQNRQGRGGGVTARSEGEKAAPVALASRVPYGGEEGSACESRTLAGVPYIAGRRRFRRGHG